MTIPGGGVVLNIPELDTLKKKVSVSDNDDESLKPKKKVVTAKKVQPAAHVPVLKKVKVFFSTRLFEIVFNFKGSFSE